MSLGYYITMRSIKNFFFAFVLLTGSLTISGESVINLIADSDHQSIQSRTLNESLFALATKKTIIYGIEAADWTGQDENPVLKAKFNQLGFTQTGYCYGIEDPNAKRLATAFAIFEVNQHYIKNPSLKALNKLVAFHNGFINKVVHDRTSRENVATFKKQRKTSPDINRFIDRLMKVESKTLFKDDLSNTIDKIGSLSDWSNFNKGYLLYLIDQEAKKDDPEINTKKISKVINHPIDLDQLEALREHLVVRWRDKHMARHIMQLSEMAETEKIPLYVFLGAYHIKGIKKILKDNHYDVRVFQADYILDHLDYLSNPSALAE